ncbi:lysophospholipid acyltransferase family protein [Nitratiruptor sp. SB155-2]|uniref:lysophospholipid acyltransferase family protein n=1 Tax=Nitratiruptor sp. (strain SB155-2) TaxID=387092 RepID=UPI000158710C|nr:lysophospholipid acyltransferase family protein [Nitratiruptor sp. SB155-2]BAF70589.1 conserved hypothetical protein [Nitratiruptor sp. SB155-2]
MKKETKRKIFSLLLPPIGAFFIRLLYLTCKKEFIIEGELPQKPFIVAFWHGELLMMPFLYKKIRQNHPIAVMISEHFDGELIAKTIRHFGLESIRGSTKKGGARVMISAMKKMKAGYDIAITPDGPRGPRHSVAPGIVALAQKMQAPIVVFHYSANRFWQLGSWDRFMIPKPFSKLTFYVRQPLTVDDMSEGEAKAYIKKQMLQYSNEL